MNSYAEHKVTGKINNLILQVENMHIGQSSLDLTLIYVNLQNQQMIDIRSTSPNILSWSSSLISKSILCPIFLKCIAYGQCGKGILGLI